MMRTNVVLSLFLLLAAVSSWGTECVCQLVNVKGSVLYKGPCLRIENKGTAENTFSRGSFFLKKSNSDIFQKSDSVSSIEKRGVKASLSSKILKKEASSSQSDQYYLRTNFYAINGIGYKFRRDAAENFETLFLYVEDEVQRQFPEDTISTGLIFNKTSQDIYTDFIQSVYLKAKDLGIDDYVINLGYTLFLSAASVIAENLFLDNEIADKIVELEKYKDELWVDIVAENAITENALRSVLTNSAKNKARALVLGHSQGGLYAYKAFNSFPDSVRGHFYSLNVAVPTDKNPNWFLANDKDAIINMFRIRMINDIPQGEPNSSNDGSDYGGEGGHYHSWLASYYNPHLASYAKINNAIVNAFRTVPYWEKGKKSALYQLVWYNGAAQTTIEIAKSDGSFELLGTYHGYNVTDPTIKTISCILLQNGVPVLRVKSYHHDSWWGPYLSTDPGFFEIISNDDGSLTYLMSDAWSPYSYDDAKFSITLMVE